MCVFSFDRVVRSFLVEESDRVRSGIYTEEEEEREDRVRFVYFRFGYFFFSFLEFLISFRKGVGVGSV